MRSLPALLLAGACFLPFTTTVAGDAVENETRSATSDDGVRASVATLQLSLSSVKAIPAKKAWEEALALELAVRDVTAQIRRYRSYFAEYPSEIVSGEAEALIARAYLLAQSLERLGGPRRNLSHAGRIQAYARTIDVTIPPNDKDHVAVAASNSR